MSIDRKIISGASILAIVGLLCLPNSAKAQLSNVYDCEDLAPDRTYFDPCPGKDQREIALPMPLGLEMVVRSISVPGRDFWHDPARVIRMGNPNAPIYEAARVVSVAGSFLNKSGNGWEIYLGKYEVTVAQFIAVIGDGDLKLGVKELVDRSRQGPNGTPLPEFEALAADLQSQVAAATLASPLRGLSHRDYREFLDRYTAWCLNASECATKLPSLDGYPALFRLPTETEWEYVARGGIDLNADPPFDWTVALPFPKASADLYARIAPASERKPTVIGRYRATDGFYDLFGNVRELTEDRFTAEPGQGRVGGFTLRGGGFRDSVVDLHSGQRREFSIYRQTEDRMENGLRQMRLSRPSDVGIRIALGTPVAVTDAFQEEIEASYEEYRRNARFESGVEKSGQPGLTRAASELARLTELATVLRRIPANSDYADILENEIRTIETILNNEARKVAVELVEAAIIEAAEAGRLIQDIRRDEEDLIRRPPTSGEKKYVTDWRARTTDRLERRRAVYELVKKAYKSRISEIASYRAYADEALKSVGGREFASALDKEGYKWVDKHARSMLNGDTSVEDWIKDLEGGFL